MSYAVRFLKGCARRFLGDGQRACALNFIRAMAESDNPREMRNDAGFVKPLHGNLTGLYAAKVQDYGHYRVVADIQDGDPGTITVVSMGDRGFDVYTNTGVLEYAQRRRKCAKK